MYLPLELNTPALVGGVISHFVNKRSESVGGAPGRTMRERAIIIASGLMAGGALGGVFGAGLRLFAGYREDLIKLPFYDNDPVSQIVSAAGFVLLCLYLWFGCHEEGEARLTDRLGALTATALLGIDTLWGGDVMNPSGTGRAVVDSWFSDEPMPEAYTHPAAARLRSAGGVAAKEPDRAAVDAYLAAIDVKGAIDAVSAAAGATLPGLRGAFFDGLSQCLSAMWDLSMELLGRGPAVPYERCVVAATGRPPEPSRPEEKRRRLAELLARAGHPSKTGDELLAAVDAWRRERMVPPKTIATLANAFIARFDAGTTKHLAPHLPADLRDVPRSNMTFVPIQDAWFSGFMNYIGRARNADGSPQYEATYEINASLQISRPGVRAARRPRGRAGARDDGSPDAGPLRARPGRLRGHDPRDEHTLGNARRGHRQQRGPDGDGPDRGRAGSRRRTSRSASGSRTSRTTPRTRLRTGPGAKARPPTRSPLRSAATASSPRSARASSPTPGAGTRSSAA